MHSTDQSMSTFILNYVTHTDTNRNDNYCADICLMIRINVPTNLKFLNVGPVSVGMQFIKMSHLLMTGDCQEKYVPHFNISPSVV